MSTPLSDAIDLLVAMARVRVHERIEQSSLAAHAAILRSAQFARRSLGQRYRRTTTTKRRTAA